jgi:hypothetical protein
MALKSPHILLAAENLNKLKLNLVNVIDAAAMHAIEEEISMNVGISIRRRAWQYF